MINEEKQKALEAALGQIEKHYGKGSVMKLGESGANMQVETVPTGSLSLDIALGVGGVPKGRIIEIYGPESSGIDLAKLDMRSGIERLTYALIVILVATMSAWIMALILHLKPVDFIKLSLSTEQWILFRLLASFCGVFGFSIMFNSPVRLAVAAAGIGAVANTLRLELVDLANIPPAAAAFIGALTAGLLASLLKNKVGYPRISVTVPSIVIMVPGLYLYRGFYNLGIMSLSVAASWFASAILIIAALPLGLIFARILTDKAFRYCT